MKKFLILLCLSLLILQCSKGKNDKIEGVSFEEIKPFKYVAIETKGPYNTMKSKIQELLKAVKEQKLLQNLRSPLMTVYFNSPQNCKDQNKLLWDMGFKIIPDTKVKNPLKIKTIKKMKIAKTIHIGPYKGLAKAWPDLINKLIKKGYQIGFPGIEFYLDRDPDKVSPEKRKTEIWIPVTK